MAKKQRYKVNNLADLAMPEWPCLTHMFLLKKALCHLITRNTMALQKRFVARPIAELILLYILY